jgi:hypothetical protein
MYNLQHVNKQSVLLTNVSPKLCNVYVYCFSQNLYSSAQLMPQHTYAYCDLFLFVYVLKKVWYKFPEDGETITPEHVAAMKR